MKVDRRIARTRLTLHQALMALLLEMPWKEITIQHILDRANVGRSTFYTHYKDKEDLLVSGIDNLHGMLSAAQNRRGDMIAFSRAMFEHAHGFRKTYRALVLTPVWPRVRQRIQEMLADLIRREYDHAPRRAKSDIPKELLVHFVASTFMSVLTWWVDHRNSLSPEEIDTMFQSLVTRGIRG